MKDNTVEFKQGLGLLNFKNYERAFTLFQQTLVSADEQRRTL